MAVQRLGDAGGGEQAFRLQHAIAGDEGEAFLLAEVFGEGEPHLGFRRAAGIGEQLIGDVDEGVDLADRDFHLAEARLAALLRLRPALPLARW